jgi:hypothetical protein
MEVMRLGMRESRFCIATKRFLCWFSTLINANIL